MVETVNFDARALGAPPRGWTTTIDLLDIVGREGGYGVKDRAAHHALNSAASSRARTAGEAGRFQALTRP
jgi:hypothetical protein